MDIVGRTAVETGAAAGIGRGCARSLAALGASVVVADVDERGGRDTVATTPEALATLVAVNLTSVIVGTRLAVDRFGPGRGGVVVNVASLGALLPLEDEPGYSATKAGVVMFTRACGALGRSHGIRVNAGLPALVDTALLAKSGDGTDEAAWARQAREIQPLVSPDDVAEAVVDMVTDDSLAGQYRIVGELPDFVTAML